MLDNYPIPPKNGHLTHINSKLTVCVPLAVWRWCCEDFEMKNLKHLDWVFVTCEEMGSSCKGKAQIWQIWRVFTSI
jgi:hypothetical protein